MSARRPSPLFGPFRRATTRQWLYVKCMPPGTRAELATQAVVWMGLLVVLVWGVVGLLVSPVA